MAVKLLPSNTVAVRPGTKLSLHCSLINDERSFSHLTPHFSKRKVPICRLQST